MVRLEEDSELESQEMFYISIPVWCDWKRLRGQLVLGLRSFQFQYGAIGSATDNPQLKLYALFQFQYGAIGRYEFTDYFLHLTLFQFQYGAIGSPSFLAKYRRAKLFQFQYGAIGSSQPGLSVYRSGISIPVWCDWKPYASKHQSTPKTFQFQYGAIGSY